ncbi:flagellar biosynthetic protein FliO [Chengkuizengella marina]|uniref:Flagellar protein FliO/FliZ n=1 Tax=Chengkuizengella marina TaxID=2507566 RepID=A0A6N9PY73_9BACL|nr:flagellar biosynthetic protein FliO [Chengkuizengella marina]NBI27373.1 hypothetical protein [Chengkuizengella marina]
MVTLKNTTYTLNKLMSPPLNNRVEGLTEQFVFVFFVLLLIIVLIFLVIKFLTKNTMLSNRLIKHLGGIKLGQKNSIQVIEFGGDIYLVGVGDDVQLIDKIDQIEKINLIKQTLNTNHKSINFLDYKSLFNGLKKNKAEEIIHTENQTNSTFHEVIYEKINNVKKRNEKIDSMLINDKNKDRENEDD